MSKWTQELLFVRRDDNGVIVTVCDQLPEGVEYEPFVDPIERVAAGELTINEARDLSGQEPIDEPYDAEYDPCLWDSNRIEATKTVLLQEHIGEAKA
jgi:hypothetical protein